MKLIQTILSGDPNFRLWSKAGESQPKAFIRLSDGQSLLQKAFLRAQNLPGLTEVLTVTNRELFFSSEDEYREVNAQRLPTSFVLEPMGRGTAPALLAAALRAQQAHGREAILLVLPADHLIAQPAVFEAAMAQALQLAQQGQWVAIGVPPAGPETAYAYFELKDQRVSGLINRPDFEQAMHFASSGQHVCNTGIYCVSVGTVLDEAAEHAPDLLALVQDCWQNSRASLGGDVSQIQLDVQRFAQVPACSIEDVLVGLSRKVSLVTCQMGWSDIGLWAALGELTPPDAQGNRSLGAVVLDDSRNCTVQASERPVGAVGVSDLMIVDTPEALLVLGKQRAAELGPVLARLRHRGAADRAAEVVYRPWGSYCPIHESAGIKIRRLQIKAGASLTLQVHQHRSEHWVVVNGLAHIATGDQNIVITPHRSAYISAGQKHRLYNPGQTPCELIEIQAGSYLGEDDVVRFEEKLMA